VADEARLEAGLELGERRYDDEEAVEYAGDMGGDSMGLQLDTIKS